METGFKGWQGFDPRIDDGQQPRSPRFDRELARVAWMEGRQLNTPGTVLAVSDSHLLYSGPEAAGLTRFGLEDKITARGRRLRIAALSMLLAAFLLSRGAYLIDLCKSLLEGGGGRGDEDRADVSLPGPPPALVRAILDGDAVLWAGAGLSAAPGFPTRRDFLGGLIRSASTEEWGDSARTSKFFAQWNRGRHEEAMDAFAKTMPELRGRILEYPRPIYLRTVNLPRAHQSLASLPFAAAVTTNYDILLERMGAAWAGNVQDPKSTGVGAAARLAQFIVLKLYGDPMARESVVLSRADLRLLDAPKSLLPRQFAVAAEARNPQLETSLAPAEGD